MSTSQRHKQSVESEITKLLHDKGIVACDHENG